MYSQDPRKKNKSNRRGKIFKELMAKNIPTQMENF